MPTLLFLLLSVLFTCRFGIKQIRTSCFPCPRGKFQGKTGAVACKDCSRGHVTADPGMLNCTLCKPGRFWDNTGNFLACRVCPEGRYQDEGGWDTCYNCPKERRYSCPNRTACTITRICPTGRFKTPSNVTNETRLDDAVRANDCTACPGGKFFPTTGGALCFACPRGKFSGYGKPKCTMCPLGQYSYVGSPVCTIGVSCPAGKYPLQKRGKHWQCIACVPGRYDSQASKVARHQSVRA